MFVKIQHVTVNGEEIKFVKWDSENNEINVLLKDGSMLTETDYNVQKYDALAKKLETLYDLVVSDVKK